MSDPQKTIQNLNRQYFDAIINPVEKIYIDMEMLQDLKLGALLSTATVKEEVSYIYSRLPVYNEKLNLRTAEYFPILHKTDETLFDIMHKDPFKVAFLSPWTRIYNNFMEVLSFLVINSKTTNEKRKPLTIVVNCSDIEYPIELFDKFVKNICSIFHGIVFKLSNYKRYDANVEFYDSFDMFFLYDYEAFVNNLKIFDSLTSRDKYSSKIIYALPLINDSLKIDPSEYPKALTSATAILGIFCDFFYMQGGILFPNK